MSDFLDIVQHKTNELAAKRAKAVDEVTRSILERNGILVGLTYTSENAEFIRKAIADLGMELSIKFTKTNEGEIVRVELLKKVDEARLFIKHPTIKFKRQV